MCPEDLSKSALNPPNSDTPLDLTAATAVSSNDPVQPLNNECLLLRQASANAPSASVGGVSFLMQQLEALRVSRLSPVTSLVLSIVGKPIHHSSG